MDPGLRRGDSLGVDLEHSSVTASCKKEVQGIIPCCQLHKLPRGERIRPIAVHPQVTPVPPKPQ